MTIRRWAATLASVCLVGTATAQSPIRPPFDVLPPSPPPLGNLPNIPEPPGISKGLSVTELPSVDLSPTKPIAAPPMLPTTHPTNVIAPLARPTVGSVIAKPAVRTATQSPAPMVIPNAPVNPPPAVSAPPSPGSIVAAPAPTNEGLTPHLKFKPGDNNLLQMETQNGLFKFFVGGRLQIDGTWLSTTDNVQTPTNKGGIGNVQDAANFRRARFDLGGTFYKNIDFLLEFDFINTVNAERRGDVLPINTPAPTDLWITFKELPVIGNLRIGNQKPPVSFEHLTSSRFLNFMERSLAFDAFVENQNNGFENGIMAFNNAFDQRMYWALGVFKNTRNIFGWNTGDGEYDVTGRITCLPVWENNGETLVHLGISASHRDLDDDQDRMRARLMVRDGPAVLHNIVAEARLFGDSRNQVVPEFVTVYGPWTFQAEYYATWIDNARTPVPNPTINNGRVFFQGGYAEALYFLTGEHRTYNRAAAAFSRVTPRSNFTGCDLGGSGDCDDCQTGAGTQRGGGIGAWQLGLRYSWLDMDNKFIRGGTVHDVTLGLNWFLNPYLKVQWNYTALYRNAFNEKADGWVHGFGTRIAFDF